MRLRAALVPLTATLASALVPGVAHAAVPNKPAKRTLACPTGTKSARLWWSKDSKGFMTKLAVDNPCDEWLTWVFGGYYYSGAADNVASVAPHSHFNWGKKALQSWAGGVFIDDGPIGFKPAPDCGDGPTTVIFIYGYRDVRYADQDPQCFTS